MKKDGEITITKVQHDQIISLLESIKEKSSSDLSKSISFALKKLKSGGRVNLKDGGCAQIKGWGKARKR